MSLVRDWSGGNIEDVLASFDPPSDISTAVISIEVKNGMTKSGIGDAARQVHVAQSYLSGINRENSRVYRAGFIGYVRNFDVNPSLVPRGVDAVLSTPRLNEAVLQDAIVTTIAYARIAGDDSPIDGDQIQILRKMFHAHKKGKLTGPLTQLFDYGRNGYFQDCVRPNFPEYKRGADFSRDFIGVRGVVFEMYFACAFHRVDPHGKALVRTIFQEGSMRSDIDVLFVTTADRLPSILKELNSDYGILSRYSVDFKEKLKKL